MKIVAVILLMGLLAGCPAGPKPADTAQGVASAEITLTGMYKAVDAMITNRSVTYDQAKRLLDILDRARTNLEAADKALAAGIPTDAVSALGLANQLLLQYQQTLQAEGVHQ